MSTVKDHVAARPVGTTAGLVALLVVAANLLGANLDATTAASVIGALSAFVSLFNPNTTP